MAQVILRPDSVISSTGFDGEAYSRKGSITLLR